MSDYYPNDEEVTSSLRVTAAAISVGQEKWRFRVSHVRNELGDAAPSDKTIRRALRSLNKLGVVSHGENSPYWMLDSDLK